MHKHVKMNSFGNHNVMIFIAMIKKLTLKFSFIYIYVRNKMFYIYKCT